MCSAKKGRKLNSESCDPAVLHSHAFGEKFQLVRPAPQQHDVLVLTSLIRDDENIEGMIRAPMSYMCCGVHAITDCGC